MIFPGSADDPAQTPRRPRFAIGLVRLTDRFQWRKAAAIASCAILPSACLDAISHISDGPSPRSAKIDEVSDALTARFTSPERSGRFETARRRLVGGALSPSRVYGDTSIWSATFPPATKALTARGGLTDRGYRFEIAPERSAPLKLGDTRHAITLRKLSDNEFRWNTTVDFAMGSLTAADAAAMLVDLLASGHGHDAAALRANAHAGFPRSSAVLARVFSIDSLTIRPGAQGTSTIIMTLGIRAEGLRATAPHFADYITKYVSRSRYRFSLTDRACAMYFDAVGGDQRLTVRYRVRAGTLVTYFGPPRVLPDSLRLVSDLSMHVKMFDVGWKNLTTDFTIRRTEYSRSWVIVAQSEPDWHLPLITERLLRSPLRRPFQGEGASFEIGVVDSVGAQALLFRRAHLETKESAILRFMGGLVSRVFDDLDAAVEREEAAYFRELMVAFQRDARGVLGK